MSSDSISPFAKAHSDILSVKPETPEDTEKVVMELKTRGNAAFKSKRPEEAHLLYSAALDLDQNNWAVFGNRSAVNEMMGKGDEALKDANSAIELNVSWAKAYFRKGKALACLKRYRESTEAYEAGLVLEPDSKMLKKSVTKAKELEVKKATEAAKNAANVPVAKTTQMSAPTMTKVTSETKKNGSGEVVKSKSDGLMKGYKKTKDGKTTSFFTMEIDEQAKDLIGDIAPKQINAPVEDPELMAQGASVWNKGGTYEERNRNEWGEKFLRDSIGQVKKLEVEGGMSITCKEVSSMEGESSVVLRQGKKRYVFDYELKVLFDIFSTDSGDVVGSGELTCNDFNSEAEGECDMTISMKTGKEQLKTWLKKKAVEKMVNHLWLTFCTEFRSQH